MTQDEVDSLEAGDQLIIVRKFDDDSKYDVGDIYTYVQKSNDGNDLIRVQINKHEYDHEYNYNCVYIQEVEKVKEKV